MERILGLAVALLLLPPAWAGAGLDRLRQIRQLTFPPDQCYRVRDLLLEREEFKLYFSDGFLLFAEPVEGRSLAALFLAATDTGEGEIILMPPTPSERQSMARFLGEPVLSESMRTAMMFFTDDTAEALRHAMAANSFNRSDPEAGRKLIEDWQPVARNLLAGYEIRMLLDSFSPLGPAGGFFAAVISGVKVGRFDILIDPRRLEQISVGQAVWQSGQRFYEVWTNFPAQSFRESGSSKPRRQPISDPGTLEHYHLEATLAPDLEMRVTARATLVAGSLGERAFPFELSTQMRISRVRLDGRPVECLQDEALDSSATRRRGNGWLMVLPDEPLAPGSRHQIEFQYEGNVITDAGKGVYFVGARGSWYPTRGLHFTDYELLFHHPRRLQLVATGRMLESSLEGDVRTSRWKPDGPIRVAGFNLGNFERTSLRVGDCTVEVCANRSLEAALQQQPLALTIPPPPGRRLPLRPPAFTSGQDAPPEPLRRLNEVARDSADALEFFTARFGALPLRQLTISPIPGGFGQGFPGLVYLATLSYYQAEDKPLDKMPPEARLFYSEQLRAHEIAHQWWGNLVTAASYHDEWLIESLADYSSLLFLEHHKGARVLDSVLAHYRSGLLAKTESGETVESAGAIVLGERLRTSKSPASYYAITYQKGAWVLHMLRRLLGDAKFLSLLAELRRQYQYKGVSTEQFIELAGHFLPAAPAGQKGDPRNDSRLENFFAQWVYATGIPTMQLQYKVTGKAPRLRLAGVVKQSGVPDDFSVSLPVEIQVPGRSDRLVTRVQTAGGETAFSVPLSQRPTKVQLDPKESVLAVK